MKNIKRTLASMLAIMMLMTSIPALSVEMEAEQALLVEEVVEAAFVDEVVEEAEESFLPVPEGLEEEEEVEVLFEEDAVEPEEIPAENDAPVMVLAIQNMEGVAVAKGGSLTDLEIYNAAIVHENTTLQMKVKLVPEDADIGTIYWSSSNENVATVNNDGVVTTKDVEKPRTVIITATSADGLFEKEFDLTVVPIALATEVAISANTNEVGLKKSIKLYADVISGDDEASIQDVTWKIKSGSKYASIKASGAGVATLTGKKAGKVVVIATAKDGSKVVSEEFNVVVKSKAASSVKVESVNGVTALNADATDKTLALKATVSSSSASQKVAWSVDEKYADIAEIDENGVLSIVDGAYGEIVVKATALDGSNKSGTLTINIYNTVNSIDLFADTTEVAVKKSITVYAQTNAEDGVPSVEGVNWKSLNTKIAKVAANADGSVKITGVKAGTADIVATAKDGSGVTATFTVTVMAKAASSVAITAEGKPFINVDAEEKTLNLTAAVSPATASQVISWSIADEYADIATVEDGVVTATGEKMGIVPVVASALDGSGKSATMYVHVGKPAAAIAFVGADTVAVKKSITVAPALTDAEGNPLPCGAEISVVSGGAYATLKVNADGTFTLTGKKAGNIVIKAASLAEDGVAIEQVFTVKKSATSLKITGAKNFVLNEMPVDDEGNLAHGEETNYLLTAVEGATWTSSNPGLISVDAEGRVMLEKCEPGYAIIKAEKDGKIGTVVIKAFYKTEEIALSADLIDDEGTAHVVKGVSTKLIADVYPADADNTALTWKTSNKKIATVSSAGVVKGVKAGTATITATAKDGGAEKATIKVVVHDAPSSVALAQDGKTVKSGSVIYLYNEGDTASLTATVKPSKAYPIVEWTSNNEDVAIVEDGEITVVGKGTAKITAKTVDGKNKSAYVYVVVGTPAEEVVISGERSVTVKKSVTLTAEVFPENAANKAITWEIAEGYEGIATVSSKGVVTGKIAGKYAKILAVSDVEGVVGEHFVYVAPKSTKVHIYKADEEITGKTVNFYRNLGNGTMQLSARLDPVYADQSVTWKSSSTKIATVDKNGVVTAKKNGTVTITATAVDGSKKKATTKLKISTLKLGVEIVSADDVYELTAGTATQLTAVITPEDQASLPVEWYSENDEIAIVDETGLVSAMPGVVGEVTIFADCNGVVAEYPIKVVLPPEEVVIVAPETLIDMNSDVKTIQLTAQVKPEGASQRVEWKSENEAVATVDANGLVTAVSSGEAKIVATHADVSELSSEITIKVVKLPKALTLSADVTRLYAGETVVIDAELTPADVDNANLVWESSDADVEVSTLEGEYVAIVSDAVTAVKKVTLTATTEEALDDVKATIELTVSSIEAVFEVSEDGKTITKYVGDEAIVRIPDSIKTIANGAFAGDNANKVTDLIMGEEVEIESGALTGLGGLADEKGFLVLDGRLITYKGDEAEVTVPADVTRVDDGAFEGNTKITKVVLPNTITVIGKRAFAGCTNLSEMTCYDPE